MSNQLNFNCSVWRKKANNHMLNATGIQNYFNRFSDFELMDKFMWFTCKEAVNYIVEGSTNEIHLQSCRSM